MPTSDDTDPDKDAVHQGATARKPYKYLWPTWWDEMGIDHPDVPFPKFRLLLGENPGPEEILRRAREIEREMKGAQEP